METGAKAALAHILLVGGPKIMDLYMSQANQATIKYADFMEVLDKQLSMPNKRVAHFIFRDARLRDGETLTEYVAHLRTLAIAAGIADDQVDAEILSNIALHTSSNELKMKALEERVTLKELLDWQQSFTLRQQCVLNNLSNFKTSGVRVNNV